LASAIRQIVIAPDVSKVWVRLDQLSHPAVLDLRHTPAVLVKPETTPASRPASPGNLPFLKIIKYQPTTLQIACVLKCS
jgi:hypothetical protein